MHARWNTIHLAAVVIVFTYALLFVCVVYFLRIKLLPCLDSYLMSIWWYINYVNRSLDNQSLLTCLYNYMCVIALHGYALQLYHINFIFAHNSSYMMVFKTISYCKKFKALYIVSLFFDFLFGLLIFFVSTCWFPFFVISETSVCNHQETGKSITIFSYWAKFCSTHLYGAQSTLKIRSWKIIM